MASVFDVAGKSKHHTISYDSLSKDAQDRFDVKQLSDYEDAIFLLHSIILHEL